MAKKPVGWRQEKARHSLAARGIKSGKKKKNKKTEQFIGLCQKFHLRENMPKPQETISVAGGTAKYVRTEIEDNDGRWNDDYYTKDGYWVTHSPPYHHVYYLKPKREIFDWGGEEKKTGKREPFDWSRR